MLIILIRTVILYFLVLFVIRVMGKAELSKMDPFEMVVLFMIAELAAIPIESLDIPLLNGAAAIVTLLFLEVVISCLSVWNHKFNHFLNGKPSILINKSSINEHEMRRQRLTIDDLMQQLRLKNYSSLADVEYAILEANGEVSVIPKTAKAPLTPSDMKLPTTSSSIPLILISDGVVYHENLKLLGKNEEYLHRELVKTGVKQFSHVFLCFSDGERRLHIYPKGENRKGLRREVSSK